MLFVKNDICNLQHESVGLNCVIQDPTFPMASLCKTKVPGIHEAMVASWKWMRKAKDWGKWPSLVEAYV